MRIERFLFTAICYLVLVSGINMHAQKLSNPLFNGFNAADPTIVKYEGNYYIYATIDPWGSNELAVFVTKDFVN
ncbi:MAG TPA: hypothetical protein VIH57_04125 [Bacteroidales bacterium]